jgi:hypothetical protein
VVYRVQADMEPDSTFCMVILLGTLLHLRMLVRLNNFDKGRLVIWEQAHSVGLDPIVDHSVLA